MLPVSSKSCNQFWGKMSALTFSGRMKERYLVSTSEAILNNFGYQSQRSFQ